MARAKGKNSKARVVPTTSSQLDLVEAELRYAGDRAEIVKICAQIEAHLRSLGLPDYYWDYIELGRAQKKNFAQKFSNALAQKVANALRPKFKGIYPDEEGRGHERASRGAAGLKKLDVNFSNPQFGLGFAVSIKTINFMDKGSGRYTKNVMRADGELRAEAQDCHTRQPYAFLAAIILLPDDSSMDGVDTYSSLKHAWDAYRRRSGRKATTEDASLFEMVFLGTYDTRPDHFGEVSFFEMGTEPPDRGMPENVISFTEVIRRIAEGFRIRTPA